MGVVTTLVLLLGGESGSPLDRVLPEHVVMRVRLATLQKGMSHDEVIRRLGLKGREATSFAATVTNSRRLYEVGRTHQLALWYTIQDGPGIRHGFVEAILTRNVDK
jgi:hypothetical protein